MPTTAPKLMQITVSRVPLNLPPQWKWPPQAMNACHT